MTRRVVAAATVDCGLVTLHVTAAATFVHVYQLPAAASCALIVEFATGVESSVNVTESMFAGFDAFRLYLTELTTYPEIVPEPSPAFVFGTVLVAVNA
jgi:hypothetical protein